MPLIEDVPATPTAPARQCHWGQIEGARIRGRSCTTTVWICEYPYRTIRRFGPGEDCAGCPGYEALKQQRAQDALAGQPDVPVDR